MIRLKNEEEIDGIRKSCHLLADMFKFLIPQVKAGMSTKSLFFVEDDRTASSSQIAAV